jgi:hypothetical protein
LAESGGVRQSSAMSRSVREELAMRATIDRNGINSRRERRFAAPSRLRR